MRFSAATMAILALSADWATAARINGVIGEELEYQLTKNRELYPKASKKASKAAFSCGVSGTSSKSSKKSTSDNDSCDLPISVICGESYMGTVTLTTGLFCPVADLGTDTSPTFGIIMDGSDAVLDCAGNDVVVDGEDNPPPGVYPAAIVLRNGATAMNCQVHSGKGDGVGVLMDEGDATLIDSDIYNKFLGVVISGDGCRTLTNVRTSGNEGSGVFIREATETIVMTNLEANGNGGAGVDVFVAEGTTLDLVMDGAKLNSNGVFGLVVFDAGNGNVDVELFGTVRAIGNRFRGIVMYGPSTLTVNGKLQASSNTVYGIRLGDESELVIPESGTVIACGNGEEDIVVFNSNFSPIEFDLDSLTFDLEEGSTLIFEEEDCAASAPPNKVAECKLELEES